MKTLIFSGDFNKDIESKKIDLSTYIVRIWKPGLTRFIPPNKRVKYILYWVFHYLYIFRNKDYSSILIYKENSLIASMLIVPAHFKWPFMNNNDLQFTYVLTNSEYRGRGIAEMMLRFGVKQFNTQNRKFWYVTDNNNIASIKLCTKIGFRYQGFGDHRYLLKMKILTLQG